MAIGHLHNSNYIYRDLKAENILLEKKGYVKLTDFNVAKELEIKDLAKIFFGIPVYLAHEVILNKEYNNPADRWSLEILVYEMMFGVSPFYSTDVQEMCKRTILQPFKCPKNYQLSNLAMDFISGLLIKQPTSRLGSLTDSLEIMNHFWFSDICFSCLFAKKIIPP